MPRLLRAFLILVFVCAALPAAVPPVYAADAHLTAITNGLKSYADTVLDSLGHFEELGQALPLTVLNPSADDALNLDAVMGDLFASLTGSYVDESALASALKSLSTVDPGGVDVTVSGASVTRSGSFIDVTFTVAASRTVAVPLTFGQDALSLSGSDLTVTFSLTSSPSFRYDTALAATPDLAFYLTSPPALNLTMTTARCPYR